MLYGYCIVGEVAEREGFFRSIVVHGMVPTLYRTFVSHRCLCMQITCNTPEAHVMRAARIIRTSLFIRPLLPFPTTSLYHLLTSHSVVSVTMVATMSTTTSTSPPIKNGVRIVSYNLLSSKLARPSHFTHAEPEHLEFDYRLRVILAKLDEEMNRGFGGNEDSQQWIPPAIFALQEVCYPFASALHTFFAQRGYHFVTGLYGKKFNGYVIYFVVVK